MNPTVVTDFTSPDWRHKAQFTYAGEVRFGPPYFIVALDGHPLRRWFLRRHFGSACVWSTDSRYLALQEWYELAELPDTEIRLIDFADGRECGLARTRNGFAEPLRFDNGILVLAVDRYDREGRARREERVSTSAPHAWRRVRFCL